MGATIPTSMFSCLSSSGVHLNPFCSSSYPTQRSDGGYPRRQNPYAQQDDNPSYEMSDVVNPSTAHLTSNMAGDNMATFYDEVEPSECHEQLSQLTNVIALLCRFHPFKIASNFSTRTSRGYQTYMHGHLTTRTMLRQRAILNCWKTLSARRVPSAQLSNEGSRL